MAPPLVLTIDDSEAVLAYERAALSGHYAVAAATNGRDGLRLIRELHPDVVILDLTMPEMSGLDVLRASKADPTTRDIPVIIVTSEEQRAEECRRAGAAEFLEKPVRAPELARLVGRALDQARTSRGQRRVAVLLVGVGAHSFGLRLEHVAQVLDQPLLKPMPVGPPYLSGLLELHGEALIVMDLAVRLQLEHAVEPVERKLVVIEAGRTRLALCVDWVHDPDELAPGELLGRAAVQTPTGLVPVVDPFDLLSSRASSELKGALHRGSPA